MPYKNHADYILNKREYHKRPEVIERYKKKGKLYYETHKKEIFKKAKIAYRKNPKKHIARQLLLRAIRLGKIKRLPCQKCGKTIKIEAHHEDYTKPYDVKWLCRPHHHEHHPKYDIIKYGKTLTQTEKGL